MCIAPIAGMLCDRFGRKPIMYVGIGLSLSLVLPCYWAMTQWPSVALVCAATGILSGSGALWGTPVVVGIVESLPRKARSGGFGILYSVATAIFGGCTQFVVKWLIDVTGSPLAPAWYTIFALLVGAAAMLGLKESAPAVGSR